MSQWDSNAGETQAEYFGHAQRGGSRGSGGGGGGCSPSDALLALHRCVAAAERHGMEQDAIQRAQRGLTLLAEAISGGRGAGRSEYIGPYGNGGGQFGGPGGR